ncbi:uncharacterized protein LOC111052208 [Nilaparvata lugens]|uniref:uncharacterized protein LOC111052208 n=1 Tax=Nilaparvata lugens TaxID=108931 RepID=UPI00193DE596|nr:uncharacterized protein LOC111052208 [Nilaparvata lugens]
MKGFVNNFSSVILILLLSSQATTFKDGIKTNHSGIVKHRTSRYLVFPKKSNVVLSLVLLKATNVGRGLNTLHEIDFFFPLPTKSVFATTRQQKSLQLQVIDAFQMFGLNGTSCLHRAICEMKIIDNRLKQSHQEAEDLVHELLTIFLGKLKVFNKSQDTIQCDSVGNLCSVSFLNLWHHFFYSVVNYFERNRL